MSYVVNDNKQIGNTNTSSVMAIYGTLRVVQLVSFIYSFVSFCYWALLTLDVNMPVFVRFFLEVPYIFVRMLGYVPRGAGTDFTGAIVGSFFLVLGFFVNYIADSMEQVVSTMPKQQPRPNVPKQTSSVSPVNYSAHSDAIETIDISKRKFVFLLEVKISDVQIAVKATHADSDKLKKRICDAIIDNLNMNKLAQCGFYKKNLFIVYKDFDYIDSFIYYIKVTLDSLAKEFASPQLMIDFNVTFSIISSLSQLENELILMDMILTLNMMNEFVSTAKFKSAYEGRERTKYVLVTKGTYNLSRNLSINNNQDLFTIRERRL